MFFIQFFYINLKWLNLFCYYNLLGEPKKSNLRPLWPQRVIKNHKNPQKPHSYMATAHNTIMYNSHSSQQSHQRFLTMIVLNTDFFFQLWNLKYDYNLLNHVRWLDHYYHKNMRFWSAPCKLTILLYAYIWIFSTRLDFSGLVWGHHCATDSARPSKE